LDRPFFHKPIDSCVEFLYNEYAVVKHNDMLYVAATSMRRRIVTVERRGSDCYIFPDVLRAGRHGRSGMKSKALSVSMCLMVGAIMVACKAPFQAESKTQSTEVAADILAIQTVRARMFPDTPTITVTPTSTPIPADTPTPTTPPSPTPTSTPTATHTPSPTPALSISGRVTDAATRQGIGGARVAAQHVDQYGWEWPYSAVTASDGNYALFDLPTGGYVVRVVASGYAREYWDNVTPSHEATVLEVSAGATPLSIDFVLAEGGSISGHVYRSEGSTPIEEAEVFVRPSKYANDDGFWVVTGADGAYKVEGLSLGNFKVMAEAPGFAGGRYNDGAEGTYGWNNAADVMVSPPVTIPDIDINLHRAASISGHVYQSDGSTSVPYVAIAAVTTDISGSDGWGNSSNDVGYYVIGDLPPGSYKLRAHNPVGFASGFYDSKPDWSSADVVTVAEGETLTGTDFTLEVGAPLRGHVYNEAGGPISGAYMHAETAGGSWVVSGNRTDRLGKYEFWVGTGDYRIMAGAPGYAAKWNSNYYDTENADLIRVEAPNEISGIDFYLAKAGTISGHVYQVDGTTPIGSASVYAFPTASDHPGAGANTEPDGSYTIKGLPSGTYKIYATFSDRVAEYYSNAPDEASATAVTVNAPDDTPNIDFTMSPVAE
jgi:hypothetical protein